MENAVHPYRSPLDPIEDEIWPNDKVTVAFERKVFVSHTGSKSRIAL